MKIDEIEKPATNPATLRVRTARELLALAQRNGIEGAPKDKPGLIERLTEVRPDGTQAATGG